MAWYDDIVSAISSGVGTVADAFRTPEYESGDVVGYDYDISKILGAAGGAASLLGYDITGSGGQQKSGYQGKIPTYTATRAQVPNTYDPDRRPGSGGQRYFTDVSYAGGDPTAEAAGLEALNRANAAAQTRTNAPMTGIYAAREAAAAQAAQQAAAQQASTQQPFQVGIGALASGGIIGLKEGKYLDGATDGMADEKPAVIDGEEPALLSDGEFVIPADVVSHLGNGNSDAGAKVLEDMMARVRKERTGSTKQGKEIDPEEFLPV